MQKSYKTRFLKNINLIYDLTISHTDLVFARFSMIIFLLHRFRYIASSSIRHHQYA